MANERARGLGYKFVTDDKYLVNPFSPTEGISYEGDGSPVSYANSMGGIMSQAPYIYPPINQGGGGGDGPVDLGPTDYGYESSYESTGTTPGENANYLNDIGEGSIDEEDIKNNKPGILKQLGQMSMAFSNPVGTIGYGIYKNYKQKKENEQRRQEAQQQLEAQQLADKQMAANQKNNTGGYQAGYGSDFMDGPSGASTGNNPGDKGGSDSMGSFAKGGRVGYFFGGRVNYKVGGRVSFKNGGLAGLL